MLANTADIDVYCYWPLDEVKLNVLNTVDLPILLLADEEESFVVKA
jgi:hypothetical protein